MYFVKPLIYTVLYVVFIELIGSWIYIADYAKAEFLVDGYYYLINGIIMIVSLVLFTFFMNHRTFKLPQLTTINWYIFSVLIGLSFVFIQTPLNWIYTLISGDEYKIIYDFNGFGNFTNVNVISTVLLIPIAEELFFREFIQRNLQKQSHVIISIGLTSILFALIHLPYLNLFFGYSTFNFHQAYIALFGGAILGFVYYKSNSIGPPIILHVLWNIMVVIV